MCITPVNLDVKSVTMKFVCSGCGEKVSRLILQKMPFSSHIRSLVQSGTRNNMKCETCRAKMVIPRITVWLAPKKTANLKEIRAKLICKNSDCGITWHTNFTIENSEILDILHSKDLCGKSCCPKCNSKDYTVGHVAMSSQL